MGGKTKGKERRMVVRACRVNCSWSCKNSGSMSRIALTSESVLEASDLPRALCAGTCIIAGCNES